MNGQIRDCFQGSDIRCLPLWLLRVILCPPNTRGKVSNSVDLNPWDYLAAESRHIKPPIWRAPKTTIVKIEPINIYISLHEARQESQGRLSGGLALQALGPGGNYIYIIPQISIDGIVL